MRQPSPARAPRSCFQCALPLLRYRRVAAKPGQPVAEFLVTVGKRKASPWWRARGPDILQRPDNRSQVARCLHGVDGLYRQGLTVDPGQNVSVVGLIIAWLPLCDRNRHLNRKRGSEHGQPVELFTARLGGSIAAGKSDRQPAHQPGVQIFLVGVHLPRHGRNRSGASWRLGAASRRQGGSGGDIDSGTAGGSLIASSRLRAR